uniref:STAS domain-containing protein n=1 Tax=Paractinoplanes polyasparticus TaxID=2856853 RepID=UPI001C8553FF|nr:STAS domain-containing protein [Actinoplanes polyasparticus]
MNLLHITTAPVADGVLGICIAGEVDMATAGQVTDAVHTALAAGPREVHVDMAAVPFLDSSGIRMLLQAQREASEQGIVLRVVNPHRRVVEVLDVTGLLDLLQDGPAPT